MLARFSRSDERHSFVFEAFGVRIRVVADDPEIASELRNRVEKMFPDGLVKFMRAPRARAGLTFSVRTSSRSRLDLYFGDKRITGGDDRDIFFRFVDSRLRLTVAERARDKVFVHAGVVEWKGQAIVLPARSFAGKTTLIEELTKLSATYYSDEYAVFDDRGFVHPFTKSLSVRRTSIIYGPQDEVDVGVVGGTKGTLPVPVGLVLLTEFEPGRKFEPEFLSVGLGMLEILPHTISATLRPEFSLNVLNNALSRAIIVRSKRGEAKDFAVKLLSFFEKRMQ